MRTDALIEMLATGVEPVDVRAGGRRFAVAVALGLAGAALVMLGVLGLNAELARYATLPMFWVRAAFPLLLAAAALALAARLAHPGARLGRAPAAIAAPPLAMWALAVATLAAAAPGERLALVLGETWSACPINIAMLAAPAFLAMLWAVRGLAPTRLRLAGAAAGLAAGAQGALVYTLHCPELAAPFLGVWYVLGMLIPAAAGALLAPRVLAW